MNLRGAEAQALDPMTVLGDFLVQLGMVDLPDDLDGRTRAYRSRVAGRRILVVLDNAADDGQVQPLLPGSASCKVLVTSRRRLGLAGARQVMLDVLSGDDAVELLGQMCRPHRIAAEYEHARDIVRRCGHLPIAIRIAGAVLVKRPQQSLARFAGQLGQERSLDVLSAEGSDDVRTSFAMSYRSLAPPEQRQFRLLGLLRAPDFPAWVGDVALGTANGKGARTSIDRLVDAQLLEDGRGQEDTAGQCRYRFHDLLREFAQDRLGATESPAVKLDAVERIVTGYLRLSEVASQRLQPVREDTPRSEGRWFEGNPFRNGALAWFVAERVSLVAAVEQASEAGFSTVTWQLSLSLEAFFERRTHWDSWQYTGELALSAATAAGDLDGEAQMLRSLGYLARERGRPRESLRLLEQSRRGFQALGDQFGETCVLCNMIRTYRDLGRFTDALECYESALPVARSFGNRWLEANIHRDIGMAHRDHGDSVDAIASFEVALRLFEEVGEELLAIYTRRDIGLVYQREGEQAAGISRFQEALSGLERLRDQRGVARALNSLGVSYREQRQWPEAATCFRQSLDMFREIGDRRWEAYTLRGLGELQGKQALALRRPGSRSRRRDHWRDAEDNLRESQRILQELEDRPWEARAVLSLG